MTFKITMDSRKLKKALFTIFWYFIEKNNKLIEKVINRLLNNENNCYVCIRAGQIEFIKLPSLWIFNRSKVTLKSFLIRGLNF